MLLVMKQKKKTHFKNIHHNKKITKMGYQKGHYGKYTGNARCCMDHADTKVTKENYKASERDDAAHIDYLKRDVLYDDHHGHSDKKMTADEKHISKLAGDMKYDKKHNS